MSRTRELAKSSVSILASQGFTAIISIIFIAYFARVFSKEQMAVYAILTMLSSWTISLGELGMGTLLEKDIAHLMASGKNDRVNRLISSVLVYRTMIMSVVSLIFYWISPALSMQLFGNTENIFLIQYVVFISFLMSFTSALGSIQVAAQRFTSRSAIDVATILSQRSFCVIGFFYDGIHGFFSGFLLGTLVGMTLCFIDVRGYLTRTLIPFYEVFKECRGYFGLSLLKVAGDQIDRPLVAFLLGAEALAGYHVAKRLFDNLYGLVQAIVVPAGVKFGEVRAEGIEALKTYYYQSLVVVAHLFIPLGFFLMVVSKSALLLYGGEKYVSASSVLVGFGFTLMSLAIWVMVRQTALRLISVRHLTSQYLLTLAATLAAYGLLLPVWGEAGIPVAMGAGYAIGLTPVAWHMQKELGLIFPFRQFLATCGCGLCLLMVAIPASFFPPGVGQLALSSILSGLIYLAWLQFVGPNEVLSLIKHVFTMFPSFRMIFAK